MTPVAVDPTGAALSLLLLHADRTRRGDVEEPGDLAAVVAIERLGLELGSTEPDRIVGALEAWGSAPEHEGPVGGLVDMVQAATARGAAGWGRDASTVNPEAGAHPVARDASLLRAGTRAAHHSFEAVPYYRARYGDRGGRYALSDSVWPVHLVGEAAGLADSQVEWLAHVLAVRGMPTWLLELHLRELAAQVRSESVDPDPVDGVAERLAARRRVHVGDDALDLAEAQAQDRLEGTFALGTGALVAAAVADTRGGVTRNEDALLGWLTEESRCSPADRAALLLLRDAVGSAGR